MTFDTLQGMSSANLGTRKPSHAHLRSVSPSGTVGHTSVASGGYDDAYDYEMHGQLPPLELHNGGGGGGGGGSGGGSGAAGRGYETSLPYHSYFTRPANHQMQQTSSSSPYVAAAMVTEHAGYNQHHLDNAYGNDTQYDQTPIGYYNDSDTNSINNNYNMYVNNVWNQNALQDDPYGGISGGTHFNNGQRNQNLDSPARAESPILKSSTLRAGDHYGGDDGGGEVRSESPRAGSPSKAEESQSQQQQQQQQQ
ncbi:hypothetical protein BGZ76_003431 [Entomortierella beljakovae]|nr:hypothetical protein BGZ76_003431 [Entomortierella beljakovae]